VDSIAKMDRRFFLINLSKKVITGMALAYASKSYALSEFFKIFTENSNHKKDPCKILKEIYNEVLELGSYNEENFVKREFFIDIDRNDQNKEEHVVVLNSREGDKEKMIVQVTYFEPKRKNIIVRYAKNTRKILCFIKEEKIEIEGCDYDETEIKSLLPEILKGIRNKKKLLKLINDKK